MKGGFLFYTRGVMEGKVCKGGDGGRALYLTSIRR